MKKRIVAIEAKRGVFIGVIGGYMIFSKTDPFGLSKAVSFDTEQQAVEFFSQAMPSVANTMIFPAIDAKEDYVSCVDIIKQGYGDFTYHMIDGLDMLSTAVH